MPVLPPPAPGVRPRPPSPPGAGDRRPRWPVVLATAAAALLAGISGVVVGLAVGDDGPKRPAAASTPTLPAAAGAGGSATGLPVREVVTAVAPSIVTISADLEGGRAVGTGVVVGDHEVLTNAHVVADATEVRVRLSGETEPRPAEVVATDMGNDLALLHADVGDRPAVTFAPADSVGLGDQVLAIGFALDLDGAPSVTQGIVSALDRTLITEDGGALDGLIQTDAAISSGNSGGPLVDARARIVGINTAVARGDSTTAATNVGFAISADEVGSVLGALRDSVDGGARAEGYLGISVIERSDGGQGALVTDVEPDSPASKAGIEVGDVVVSVDDATTDGRAGVIAAIRDHEPGDRIPVVVVRDGDEQTFDVTLDQRQGD
ncbi:MAG: trypsin-like peptidase domain-containing protein [Ilumatobacteraceae bacterium]